MAGRQDGRGSAVMSSKAVATRDSIKMEESRIPHLQMAISRIPGPVVRSEGSDSSAIQGPKSSRIHPPQVRTNPRVTRQTVCNNEPSKAACIISPGASKTDQKLQSSDAHLSMDPSAFPPSSTLTRQGAFRYGRGVKPLEVLNIGSGAATLPRMRPRKRSDARNLNIFTAPKTLDSSAMDSAKEATTQNKEMEKPKPPAGKTLQRPHTLGRMAGIRHKSQESGIPRKQGMGQAKAGPKIPKAIKGGGGGAPKETDSPTNAKMPDESSITQCANISKDQKQRKDTCHNANPRSSKETSSPTNRSGLAGSLKAGGQAFGVTAKTLPGRNCTRSPSTNGFSSKVSNTTQASRETSSKLDQVNPDTPKPPPRHLKSQAPKSISTHSRTAPTNIPRPQSLGGTASSRISSARNSVTSRPERRLANKTALSFPQGTKFPEPTLTVKDKDRQRSQSVSQIPVHISRRSSFPHRQVKLRPKTTKSDRPTAVFRLSLDGVDSGTECSSSLTTTPSECSIDVDFSIENGSSIGQTTPSKFYSISGEEKEIQDESSSENLEKVAFQQIEEPVGLLEESLKENGEHSKISPSSSWLHKGTSCLDEEKSPSDSMLTTPQNEETTTNTSGTSLSKSETINSESFQTTSDHDTNSLKHQNSTNLLKTADLTTSAKEIKTSSAETVDLTGSNLNDAESNFVSTSETKTMDQNVKSRTAEKCKMMATNRQNAEAIKTKSFNQSRIGRDIALKVARGDLKATAVDDDSDTDTPSVTGERTTTTTHHKTSSSDPTPQTIGDTGIPAGQPYVRNRRKISSIEQPVSNQFVAEKTLRISGPRFLEKMMDKEDVIPRSNHKQSFHPNAKEKSEVEQSYLNSCSDPLKLLEFLMNIDDPPKVRGYRGERFQVEKVKRRTKSDVQSPRMQSEMGAELSKTNRWSMPNALEQWSQSFWAHFTSNRKSEPKGCTKEKNTMTLDLGLDVRESVTAGMPNEVQKTNSMPRKLGDIHDTRGGLLSVGTKTDSEGLLEKHRWSVPLDTGNILPSPGCSRVAEPTELAQATVIRNKTPEIPLKRKSKWRWSFPLPLQRTLRSSEYEDPGKTHPGSQISKLTRTPISLTENKEPDKSTTKPDHIKGRRAPSFSDIVDSGNTSSKSIKVFVDSSYAQQNNGFHSSESTAMSSASSHLNTKNIGPVSTNGSATISLKSEMAQGNESAPSLVVLRNREASSSGRQIKKRLSWKRERSLETVCYLERRDSSEASLTNEGISSEKDCSQSGTLSSLELIPKDQLKDDEDSLDSIDGLQENCQIEPVPIYSQWVLPPDELKSKLESVYAEQQKEISNDEKELDVRGSYHSEIVPQESDLRLSPRGAYSYPPSESIMHDMAPSSGNIGKRFSIKQQLSVSPDSDLNRRCKETQGLHSRDSLRETNSGNRTPVGEGISMYGSRSKLNRSRSSSGSESMKDTRRKLDDVSHKTRLRIERDRETKILINPPSPGSSDGLETTTLNTLQAGQKLIPSIETRLNDQPLKEENVAPADGSMKAFRRRKKSMAIALSEGLLDLQEDQATSVEKTFELQVVSQISQLNQELMQLTGHSPPRTPPTPGCSSKGNLSRSSSRGSLTSLPGSTALSFRSIIPQTRHWKSHDPNYSAPDSSAIEPVTTESEKSTGLLQTRKTQPKVSVKEEEESKEKAVFSKVLLSRIKLWSKKKGQTKTKPRPEIVKLDPESPLQESGKSLKVEEDDSQSTENVSPVSFTNAVGLQSTTPEIPHHHLIDLRPVPLSKDSALRQTWHGTPSRKPGEDNEEEGELLGRSNFKRCNSLRNPIRQRKRGLSPMENAHLVALQMSRETLAGSSVDSGIVKDRGTEEVCLAGDSDNSGSNLCSPCSSVSGSNPPSRPLSSDISDMQWEKGADVNEAVNGVCVDERKLSAVTLGRRESGSTMTKSRRPPVTRLSLDSQAAMDTSDTLLSPKKVTFSLAEDIAKKAAEEDLKRLPKPLHLPRRVKTDPVDMKTVGGLIFEMENTDASNQPRSYLRRRAQSELSSIREKNWDDIITHPPIITEEVKKATPTMTRPKSIPDQLSLLKDLQGVDETPTKKSSLADLIGSDVGEVLTTFGSQYNFEAYSPDTMPTFAEALWDHVTMDESELAFKAGDVIEVTDMRDKNWWWGCIDEVEGWVPAQFVRLRVSQGETVEECMERLKEEREQSRNQTVTKRSRKVSLSFLSNDQVRSKVVEEIITTERDYVHNLRDVCEGYISQARDRPEMFSDEVMDNLFGNIEEIYSFQKGFLLQLEATIVKDRPQLSRIGSCFLEHRRGFETYSEYCNNYPNALRDLKALREKQKYDKFFEACRLLQNMIEINLEGFLLTPVQKICKYPLQLRELLKYTRPEHADYRELREALEVMKDVAVTINDRKRRVENVDKIAAWQKSVGDWEGEDLLNRSTQLIHTGDISMLAGKRWTTGRRLFLFDRQVVVCKKDWKGSLLCKARIDLDLSKVSDMPDGKDQHWNVTVKHAFTIQDLKQNKIYIFSCKGDTEKQEWLSMFAKERESVMKDEEKGFSISASIREAAMKNVMGGDSQPSKPQNMAVVTRKVSTMPYAYQHKILESSNKKVPLPKGISSTDVFKKKKGLFGIGKK